MRVAVGSTLIALSLAGPGKAWAQSHSHASQDCAAPATLPPELAAWSARTPAVAAAAPGGLDRAVLAIGTAVDATLRRTSEVEFVAMPDRPGGSASHGGIFRFDVAEPGTYRVAIASGAWIDVLEDGKAVESSAHGHGPACSGIRKMVSFPLKAGRHVLQLSGSADPSLAVLIARVP